MFWIVDMGHLANSTMGGAPVAVPWVSKYTIPEGPAARLLAALRDRSVIVLNSCVHGVDTVASLVVAILRSAPACTTCDQREQLRVEGENVHRMGRWSVPSSAHHDATAALRFADQSSYSPFLASTTERPQRAWRFEAAPMRDAAAVGEICRKLDGIPCDKFARARAGTSGVRGYGGAPGDSLANIE